MNILLLGSGGREHAFAWKLTQSPKCQQLYIAPGNAGTADCGINVGINPNDFAAIGQFVLDHQIKMVVVGPEDPLVKGIFDYFQQDQKLKQIYVIGPSAAGAQLEGSKAYAKQFMQEWQIPTASYREFTADNLQAGLNFIAAQIPPIVLKADGLAAGKGVLILDSVKEAQSEFRAMLGGKFGTASEKVVVEAFLDGIEFSVFVLTDGNNYKILPIAKDYKRIGEGDTGLNTGGMGSVSPVPFVDDALIEKVETRIIQPTIAGLKARKIVYKGFIFLGLILVKNEPFVIEYNCRMGDPETQTVLPRLKNDLVELLVAVGENKLSAYQVEKDERAASAIILVSGGYPGVYEKGKKIRGIEKVTDSIIFHAGTKVQEDAVVTNGGRVMAITSYGPDFKKALALSNKNAAVVEFEGKYFRKDIGFDL